MVKILLICKSIAPVQFISAIRWTKLAKYLKRNHGAHITVLTDHKDFTEDPASYDPEKRDPLLEKDLVYFDAYWEVPDDPLLAKLFRQRYARKQRRKAAQGQGPAASAAAPHPTGFKKWKADVRQDLFQVRQYWEDRREAQNILQFLQNKELDFDVMISSFSPAWTFMVASAIKKKHPDILWFSDFRDPYPNVVGDGPVTFRLHKWVVRRDCAAADVILNVHEAVDTYTDPALRHAVCSNGYDPEEACPPLPPERFSMVFTGTIYGKWTNLRAIFRALRDLCADGSIEKEDISIDYAGLSGPLLRGMAEEYGLGALVHDLGVIPRTRSMELQQKAAILYQGVPYTRDMQIIWTGKSFEYMMARKPIVYEVSGELPSKASEYLPRLGGCCYEACRDEQTYPRLKQYILDKYREWKTTGNVTIQRDEEYVRQFAYPAVADRLWDLICQTKKQP